MKKLFILSTTAMMFVGSVAHAMPLLGFYKTIDDKTGNPKSIVRLYECKDEKNTDAQKMCGRIVALYDTEGKKISETLNRPERVADKVKGSPKMAGLDIIWNMEWDEDEYEDGKIMDPKNGKVYSSVVWQDEDDNTILRVRGKIGPFGRTQKWHVMNAKDLPADIQKLDVSKWKVVVVK